MLGEKIKQRRKELGYSQEYLASLLGYQSRSSIQKIEKGENDIPQSKIQQFAKALNTSSAYLLGIGEEPIGDTPIERQRFCDKVMQLNDREFRIVEGIVDSVLGGRDE